MTKALEMHYQLAEEKDLEEIYILSQAAAKVAVYSKWGEDYPTREILENDIKQQYLYKIEQDGKIYAIMKIMPWAEFQENEEADDIDTWDTSIKNPCSLGRFCISPELQGHGYGRKIMLYTMDFAKSLGYDGAFFHALDTDLVCLHLYDTLGYIRRGKVEEFGMGFICFEHKF